MDLHPFEILRRPIVTEKSTDMQENGRYVFEVAPSATKHQIKWAVQQAFDVRVTKVNTMKKPGKNETLRPPLYPPKSHQKAIVTLAPGDAITIFEGV